MGPQGESRLPGEELFLPLQVADDGHRRRILHVATPGRVQGVHHEVRPVHRPDGLWTGGPERLRPLAQRRVRHLRRRLRRRTRIPRVELPGVDQFGQHDAGVRPGRSQILTTRSPLKSAILQKLDKFSTLSHTKRALLC
ncbi:hypothetical protein AAG570_005220 [Ranatra chinensis]|uniref:Uncharacterized protein n=1 Tax=Ranatra chinensis TaxID=642074 RepID=A0ABD0YCI6_9HEMI